MDKILLSLIIAFAFGTASCSGKKVNENDPQELFKDAEDDIKDKHYLVALDKLKVLKNKFPYSSYGTKAHLRIADVHFAEEQYVEAAATYEAFRDLHPKYGQADYVAFQIGESYFNQLPSTTDRDLTPATKAIEAYRDLQTLYPQSQYIEKARQHSKEASERLAGKEKYVADFYYKRGMYDSAARRYKKILDNYPGTSIAEEANSMLSKSLSHQEQEAK